MAARAIGQPLRRIDALDKVTGRARYPQDLYVEGMLHAKVLWSEFPHARILSIDTSRAESHPGVVAVLTYKDVPVNEFGLIENDQRVLAEGKVRSVGDPVALVVAETEQAAEEARQLIKVDYEPLPVVSDPREAMQPDAPLVHEEKGSNILAHYRVRKGDVEKAFAQADVVVEGRYRTPHQEHAYLQPEAGLALIDEQGKVAVYVASQWAHDDRRQIAHALNVPEDQVRVIHTAIGGAFGGREDISLQIMLALAAWKTKRPVKMVYSREESFRGHHKRHPFFMRYKVGATKEGQLIALEAELISDAGSDASVSAVVMANAVAQATGPYEIPNVKVDGYAVHTNNILTGAMRAFGAPQVNFAMELSMEKLAQALGMDPVELRMKNVLREGSRVGTNTVVPAGVGIGETLRQAALAAGWREVDGHWIKPAKAAGGESSKRRGIGVACSWKNVGYSFGFPDHSIARVEIYGGEEMERAVVKCGVADVGQGAQTALAQIAAEVLGIPYERVEVIVSDTDVVPDAGSSSASRQTYVSGNAVRLAALRAKRRWEEGNRPAFDHCYYYPPQTTDFAPETGECYPHFSYGYTTQIVELEVDVETGEVEILKVYSAHDVGRAINPQMIEGQIEGGVVMGEGYALIEEFIQQGGFIKTRKLSEYFIPTSLDAPREVVPIVVEAPDPEGPFGAKGVGEMTVMSMAPAIAAAIHDAVGVWLNELPITAERVLRAMKKI